MAVSSVRDRDHMTEGQRRIMDSVRRERIRGCVSMVCGLTLIVCLLTFRLQEIEWSGLNRTGVVDPGSTNLFGVVGLYVAGCLYWFFGFGIWLFVLLLEWVGTYRILYGTKRKEIVSAGWVAIVCACIVMSVQPWVGEQWCIAHTASGLGGALGDFIGKTCLQSWLGTGITLTISVTLYVLALVYTMGSRPSLVLKGLLREYREMSERRAQRREEKWVDRARRKHPDLGHDEEVEQLLSSESRKEEPEEPEEPVVEPQPVPVSEERKRQELEQLRKRREELSRQRAAEQEQMRRQREEQERIRREREKQDEESLSQKEEEKRSDLDPERVVQEAESAPPKRKIFSDRGGNLITRVFSRDKKSAEGEDNNSAHRRTGDSLDELKRELQEKDGEPLPYQPRPLGGTSDWPMPEPETPSVQQPEKKNSPQHSVFPAEAGMEKYEFPSYELLKKVEISAEVTESERNELIATQRLIISSLKSFGVEVTPGPITKGPTITRYEVVPAEGLRINKITNLKDDLMRVVKAVSMHILAPVPGKDTVGIEIANRRKVPVSLRSLLEDPSFTASTKKIPLALGKDVYGNTVIGDLAAMPHLLVAGTTGSGKSVCINSIISSILYRFRPDELKFILVDPKVVEMEPYSRLPHLIIPVVTEPKKVVGALRWCVNEMERRYHLFQKVHVRNFESFNNRPPNPSENEHSVPELPGDEELADRVARELELGEGGSVWDDEDEEVDEMNEEEIPARLPYIVVIIDELADLMQTAPADTEGYIARLTQKARAAGIHLIVATQTPRSNVVTGVIKANIPSRIAFQVSSALDSRIILDQGGAENLLGKGDLLFLPPGSAKLERAQGAFVSDNEVEAIVDHCAKQAKQRFLIEVQQSIEMGGDEQDDNGSGVDAADEETFERCVEVVRSERKASTSLLQRRLRIGYGKAARMMELLEARKVIAPSDGTNRPREVLIKPRED